MDSDFTLIKIYLDILKWYLPDSAGTGASYISSFAAWWEMLRFPAISSSPRSGSRLWDDNSVMCRALQDPDAQADRSATEDRNSKGISY